MNSPTKVLLSAALLTLAAGIGGPRLASAEAVDLANVPMVTGVSKTIPPNVYFIMDDSGSMADDFMPDNVSGNRSKRCFRNFGHNKIYYNPATTYLPPVNADGTSFANSNYNAAKTDGFSSTSTTVDLAKTVFSLGNNPFTTTNGSRNVVVAHNAHGYPVGTVITFNSTVAFRGVTITAGTNYTITAVATNNYTIQVAANATSGGTGGGNGIVETANVPGYFWYEYTSNPNSPPSTCASDASYTKRVPTTAAEKTNFANWYSYYRTRVMMMKSATGRAFVSIDDKFRVGYSAISEKATGASKFLNVGKFTCCGSTTQKYKFYQKLYAAGASGYTPLRGALSKAGRLYSGTLTGASGTANPVQYSCQQNFTILTTDGYWNLQNEASGSTTANNTSNYGPYKADNVTQIGDWDAATLPVATNTGDQSETATPRPYLDAGPYSNTLADIAAYYFRNDIYPNSPTLGGYLEDGTSRLDLSKNNVPVAGADVAKWQHMTTFTIGMGVSGQLAFDPDYLTCQPTDTDCGDYPALLQGTKNWPDPRVTDTATELATRLDDLWHAAVNGHGEYLSAADPGSVVAALEKTLASISIKAGASSAAATSSLQPVKYDNFAYVAQYSTKEWYGDLLAYELDVSTGILEEDVLWSARDQLQAATTRTIHTFSSSAPSKLKPFDTDNLTAEKTAGYFRSGTTNPNGALNQYALWTTTQRGNATDEAMINYITGNSNNEDQDGNADAQRLFRDRLYRLGDIANSSPVFVKKPEFEYTDTGYAAFRNSNVNRAPTVYASANDGMLHAFDAETGDERWAYIPAMVIPYLYKLADANYSGNHRFYVDGPITVGDVYTGSAWKTILVGGLGGGGKGYFALDITDPADPKGLWEFSSSNDGDLGYAYGNPVITKRNSDGRWVVLFASGYNNGGDSKGRLYVLDAISGSKLDEIVTDNSVNDPNVSGIAKITGYVSNTMVDNTTQYVYGGDLGGSLWRFDLDDSSSKRLGKTSSTAGNQPITVKPELGRVRDESGTYHRVIYFGTGRYLGFGDVSESAPSSSEAQAIYAVKDTGEDLGVLTGDAAGLVEQTLTVTDSQRSVTEPEAVSWGSSNGWFVTLPVGERVNVDPRLQVGTLAFVVNEPGDDYCEVGGRSWLYAFNYRYGTTLAAAEVVAESIATGLSVLEVTDSLVAFITLGDTTNVTEALDRPPGDAVGVRRVSWREIN